MSEIAAVTGHGIEYQPITPEWFESGMVSQGAPPDFAAQLRALFAEVLDGRNAQLTDGVQRALGRPPRDFSDYVRTAAAGGWWESTDNRDIAV